ncbi:iron-regulated outer membrane virulence protein [Geobacter sp. OR-1]|uniref:TonB-dependent receptor plug domain-containing protein n=1 Tax=Geobacter sp. OR-1 TaxID=1266765 RepID=UPI000543836E|nr:TonB-dependent receptor [Geobacter sp. OR-1]GAM09078.1 iron-regulated outer membrane virulence protein [Geobacter sp. OR-1]
MRKMALIAIASSALCLWLNSLSLGADPPAPDAASSRGDGKELLMFFEEQDLVTATKRHTSLRKAPAIATIITADEIRNMGARNLEDVLKMVPGFGIATNEWGTHMIEVRGIRTGASEKILVMIDGHSLNRNTNGSALVYNVANKLPMENVKQVEIVRGPGSALYGNSAFVATINIITRNAEEIDGVETKLGGGSFDTFKGDLVAGKAIGDKFTAFGSLDHYKTEGPRLRVEADTLTGTPFSLAPGTPSLKTKQTDAFLKVGYGDLTFRGHYLTQNENHYIGLASALTDDSFGVLENYWGELAYGLQLMDGLSANLKVYYDYYEQIGGQAKIYPNGFAGLFPDGMIGKPELKNRTIGGELQFDWDLFKGNHLIAGVSYEVLSQYDVEQMANFNPNTGAPLGSVQKVANWNKDATRQIFATYLQDEWQLCEQVNLTAGGRFDHYSDFGDTINPRVGLVWSFLESADLKLLYGQAFRAPNFQELYNINNPVVVGNPNLKPERIETFEAGVAWRLNRYFAADMNYFYSTIDDQIGWDTTSTPAVNANIGKSETQGVEMGLNGAYGANIYWKLAYAWQDPRDANTDQRLPYVPSHRASGIVNYALTKYLNLNTNVLWTGPRPRPQGDKRPEMPSYTTVDLAVTLKNLIDNLEIQATVRNLFDQRFKDPDTSGGALNLAGTGPKIPGDFPRGGISFFVSATYRF